MQLLPSLLSSAILSSSCAACGRPGAQWCRPCRMSLASVAPVRPRAVPHGVTVRAALPFDGVARQLVVALKYRNRRAAARILAVEVVRRLRPGPADVVTWAPTSGRRAGHRGFDQAELLARAVAAQLGVPCRRLLYRRHDTATGASQTGRARWQRLLGPHFRARPGVGSLRVLLVDDVVTTGATLAAAVEALRGAGIHHVEAVAVASADRALATTRCAG